MALLPLNDPVAKGAVTRCLDALSIQADAQPRLEALRRAIIDRGGRQFAELETVFAEHLLRDFYTVEQIAAITVYLRRYWFSEESGWWPAFQPIAPIYAHGLLQALNVSLGDGKGRPLPIDSYWLAGHDKVELISLASDRQLTLLIATPTPPEPAPAGIASESSQVWVTARRSGRSAQEVDPVTAQPIQGSTALRVRTFPIQSFRRRA
jgi:hypothetical protein